MSNTTIGSFALSQSWPTDYGASGTLAIYSNSNFVDESGNQYLVGTGESLTGEFVTKVNISVSGGVGTVAAFSLPKTDLASPQNGPRYSARVFDAQGSPRDYWPFQNFHLKSILGNSISYLAWWNNNQTPVSPPPDGAPTTSQMNLAIAAANPPTDATYITQTPDSILTNEQAMSLLPTGIVWNTTGTGVLSTALAENYVSLYASLSAALTALGSSTETTLVIDSAVAANGLTVPANVHLRFTGSGQFTGTGTVIIRSDIVAPPKRIFAATLTLSLSGNNLLTGMPPEWFGAVADNSTDCTTAVQTILDIFATASKNPCVRFGQGKYVIAGALQDTLLSNAQLVLPKVSTLSSMLTVQFEGTTPPATPWNNDSGTILRSTLSSGNGVMIGVKNNQGSGVATATAYMSNASSNIFFAMSNITLQLPINPTNSALDIGHIRNYDLRNNRIVTGDFAQGGANPVVTVGTVIPDLAVTIATTATSYGINLPTNLINNGNIDGLFIAGFYTAIRTGELTKARNIVFHCCNVGFQVEGAIWPSIFQNVVIAGTARPIKATGAKSEQAGFPDTVNTSTVYFENMGVENDGLVNPVVYVVDDANNYLGGRLSIFYGVGVDLPLNPAFPPNLVITRSERPWNVREPITNITGSALTADANKFVIDELKSGYAVSNDSGLPWQLYTTNQSGTSNGLGVMVWSNDAIADGLDKRVAQFYVQTDGAINSGRFNIYVMRAGTLNLVATIDQYGNINLATGFLRSGEATLAITSNTIAPTTPVVHVSTTNTLKNITVPPGSAASFTIRLIPDGAWPYDNTGNIVGTGTAVVGRPMDATYTPSTGKFYMSY